MVLPDNRELSSINVFESNKRSLPAQSLSGLVDFEPYLHSFARWRIYPRAELGAEVSEVANLTSASIGRRRRERHQKLGPGKPWQGKMGQEASTPVDESTPPLTLKNRTVESVAGFIKDGRAMRIVVLVLIKPR